MKRDTRWLKALALGGAAGALLAGGWLALTLALLRTGLTPEERAAAEALLAPRMPLLVLMGVVLTGTLTALASWVYQTWVSPPSRLREQARVLLETDTVRALAPTAPPGVRGLAEVVDGLVAQREALRAQMAENVAEASRHVEQERSRLAALMSELALSVVVCNLDGRVLLYNNRARLQFKALSSAPQVAEGAELIGLGRSIYNVFDRALVAHALERIQQRLKRGAASPSAQFVTVTARGQLLRAQMAPVKAPAGEGMAAEPALAGFVLLLENITRDYERDSSQDSALQAYTEAGRASLASVQAALELLDTPDLEPAMRQRFLAVVREEVQAMGTRITALAEHSAADVKTRWPLEEMLGADLLAAAQRRIEAGGAQRVSAGEVDATLWLKLDSFALLQALAHLAARLHDEYTVPRLQLRLQAAPAAPAAPGTEATATRRAQLDLVWPAQALSTETVMAWESEPMRVDGQASALSIRDVMQRHGGEFWFERDRARQQVFFRFLLPLADAVREAEPAAPAVDSRPEYYDFNLFATTESTRALDERRLVDLSYTVFDTETTGLQPAAGDQIIQIGAARIVAGRLLRQESFEQLVDPQRSIPAAGIPIHGIRPEMVRGQPILEQVLPAFHAYARDTVLVAHNAAFDMRFLQLAEDRTGVRFEQPVLDTLLLSALVHPQQESHRLEAIAERFGLTIVGRHTALGDALVTAEVFLKLVPLLAAMGIHTLGQAREAAQKTYYARVQY
jgi:DNA polymerase-3 subunit epsilon